MYEWGVGRGGGRKGERGRGGREEREREEKGERIRVVEKILGAMCR